MTFAPTENGKKVLTMAEYIERDALMLRIKEIHCAECDSYNGVRCRACWVDDTLDYIDSEPEADVAPVRNGKWVHSRYENCSEKFEIVKCSCCGHEAYAMAFYVRGGKHCPNCGARMDGAE